MKPGRPLLRPLRTSRSSLNADAAVPRTEHALADCPACSHRVSPAALFCERCGTALGTHCASCGKGVASTARFCASCGAPREEALGESAPDADALADDLPGERRQLTILFCDLVGSTALASRLDPEDWQDVLRSHQARAAEVIGRHGGHVAQYLGDGLVVYFGWPRAQGDAAERAVRAGLALVTAAASVCAEGAPLAVRVGVHTGPVVVGAIGSEGRSEMLALGDAPNVAARVQAAASPGTVWMSAATQRLVAGVFEVEDGGLRTLAGVRQPIQLYRAVRPSGVRSRLSAGRLTRFVGREVELATLAERWDRVQESEGQNLLVLGEAGVGKSRLVLQLRERLADVPHTWLECGGSPFTQGTPFHPIATLVAQALGLERAESREAKLARIESGLGRLASPAAVPLLAEFLGIPGAEPLGLDPDPQRRRTIDLLVQWSLARSEAQPLVLVVEDLHWCDASTLELIGRLAAQSATSRVLLLATSRPEPAPAWPARENSTMLSLARLTKRQSRELVAALAGGSLPEATREALVARAGGVPLFVEELTKSLFAPGAAQGVEAIPATLADSLMARLDGLPEAKDVAQRAAVLGREFEYALLAAYSGLDEIALRESLARLAEAEILLVRGEPPDATYLFKHALVQEAASESLLKRKRQQLHARVVDVLLASFPERAATEPELVARHAEAAGRNDEAVAFYRRAGERAQAHSAHAESVQHFERAIELLAAQPPGRERDVREAPLQLALAASRMVALGYTDPRVAAAHERSGELCEALGDARGLGRALSGLAVFSYNSGSAERAFELAARALEIAERLGDEELLILAHCNLGQIQVFRGELADSLAHFEAAQAGARSGAPVRIASATANPTMHAFSGSAWALWGLGYPDRALASAREGVARARALAHPFSVMHALLFETVVHALRRSPELQRECAAQVLAMAESHGFPFWVGVAQIFHAAARVAAGEHEAIAEVRRAFAYTAKSGIRGGVPAPLAQLAQSYLLVGALEEADCAVDTALALAAETRQPVFDSILYLLKAKILLARGGAPDAAEALLHRALAIARGQQAKTPELRAATTLAQLLREQGRCDEARTLLAPVYAWFTEGLDLPDLIAARELLATLG